MNAIDTEKPNELINIATSFDEIYEEINEFKPLKAAGNGNGVKKEKAAVERASSKAKVVGVSERARIVDNGDHDHDDDDEPYYQVPKKQNESYYEVPSSRPIPVYENVDMYYDNAASTQKLSLSASSSKLPVPIEIGTKAAIQPPKEKPPPPPVESNDEAESDDGAEDEDAQEGEEEPLPQDPMKRINSTKRIKKEIRNKRSSFLGIEGSNLDDESFLEINVAPPPDMAALLKEERRIEKQLYMKVAGLYDSSDTAESRDSGVSENHSRQSSEPVTSSSEEQLHQQQQEQQQAALSALEMDKQLLEAGKNALALECRVRGTQQWVYNNGTSNGNTSIANGNIVSSEVAADDFDPILKALEERERARCIDDQNREEEDLLRVERELLELEQEEMKRKNMMNRKLYEQQQRLHAQQQMQIEQQHQEQLQQQQQRPQSPEVEYRRSLQDINGGGGHATANLYANVYANSGSNYHHRKSMPNLQDHVSLREAVADKVMPPIPPAKPLRVQEYLKYGKQLYGGSGGGIATNQSMPMHLNTIHTQSANDDFQPMYSSNGSGCGGRSSSSNNSINGSSSSYSNMSRHTLHVLSAVPKPKFQDTWAFNNNYENTNENGWHSNRDYIDTTANETYIRAARHKDGSDSWLSMQQKRRSDPNFNYNKHWLIQEAEQRRIDQARRSNGGGGGSEWAQLNGSSKMIPRKGSNDNKPLPDAVIQTLTQRVQNKLSDKKR